MISWRGCAGVGLILVLNPCFSQSAEKILLHLKGQYIVYSYDHNQLIGESVEFESPSVSGKGLHFKADVASLSFCVWGDLTLREGDKPLSAGDEFYFDLKAGQGILVRYGEKIETARIGAKEGKEVMPARDVLDGISLDKLRKSLVYFAGQEAEITAGSEAIGYEMILYLEGIESVKFKKIKMSEGVKQRFGGFSLNRIWYSNSQGLMIRGSYLYQKKDRISSYSWLNYEERSFLKDYTGLERQIDLMTSTTIDASDTLRLGTTTNYNSSGLWNTQLWLSQAWKQNFRTQLDFSYNKQINLRGEGWFGLQAFYSSNRYGTLSFRGGYEIQNQVLANLSYAVRLLENLELLATSSFSRIKSWQNAYTEIVNGDVSLAYGTRVFSIATDYYLNGDLLGSQLLSQPQLRLGLNPIGFYSGLLFVNFYNIFIYNNLSRGDLSTRSYSDNIVCHLDTQPIWLWSSFRLNFNLALEQFIEREGRNFTSGGVIVQGSQDLWGGLSLQAAYSAQSRRKTQKWLIEGTTSQDLSLMLRSSPSARLSGWASFSFDPKYSMWRYAYADIAIVLVKNWSLHSLANYSFIFRKLENIDLYLIRQAGRFQLRFIWRSLSRQFLVELVPR